MFIKEAFAQTQEGALAAAQAGDIAGTFQSIISLFLILIVFYFFIIRPQNKRVAEHRLMIGGLKKGDKTVTSGGIVGKVKKIVNDAEIVLEIAEGVDIHVMRSSIMSLNTLDDVNIK